jgi:hypothetical protein
MAFALRVIFAVRGRSCARSRHPLPICDGEREKLYGNAPAVTGNSMKLACCGVAQIRWVALR